MPRHSRGTTDSVGGGACKIRKRCFSSSSSPAPSALLRKYRFKRSVIVGKRGGSSSTPFPTWMLNAGSPPSMASISESSQYHPSHVSSRGREGPVSARKLATALWELNEIPPPHPAHGQQHRKSTKEKRDTSRRQQLSDPSHSPGLDTITRSRSSSYRRTMPLFQHGKQNQRATEFQSNAGFVGRFFLGGRLIFGPDVRSLVLTIFLIVTPMILFAVFVSQKLIIEFQHHLGILIMAVAVIFAFYDLALLLLTSGRDPGIVPRSAHPPEPDDGGYASNTSTDRTGSHTGASSLPPTKDVLVNGIVVKVKYCHTCMLYRPPRCSHCSICNNCVERFDHHCPWVGQCIGKRNYRFFFMFVSSTTVLCLYIFAFCWVNLKKITEAYDCNLWEAILKSPVSGILIIYTFIAAWFVGGLTAFHLYLICTNQTTYENFRYLPYYKRGEELQFNTPQQSKRMKQGFSAVGWSRSDGRDFDPSLPMFGLHGGRRIAISDGQIRPAHTRKRQKPVGPQRHMEQGPRGSRSFPMGVPSVVPSGYLT